MPFIEHNDVQVSEPWNARVFIRELNTRFMDLVSVVNRNRQESGTDGVHGTKSLGPPGASDIWLCTDHYILDHFCVVASAGSGDVTPEIGGVAVGGAPFTASTTPTRYIVTSPNTLAPLDMLGVSTGAGMTGTLTISMGLTRLT